MNKITKKSFSYHIFSKKRFLYYLFTGISTLLRPITLLILVNFNEDLSNQFSIFLIAIQFILYSCGTQIHKKFLESDTKQFNENKFFYASFLEGVLLSCVIFFVNLFVFKDIWLCIFLLFQLPIEKLIDDKQRTLSYSKKLIRMSIFLSIRALIPCVVFLLYLNSMTSNFVYVFIFIGSILLLLLFNVFPIQFNNLYQNLIIRFNGILKDAKWGLLWSFFSGVTISIDKIILNYLEYEIAEYIFRFQVIQIFLIFYTVFFFIPLRPIVLDNHKKFLKDIIFPATSISIMMLVFSITFEYVSSFISFIPNLGYEIVFLQATILSLYIITHPFVEAIFWAKELKSIAIIEMTMFLLLLLMVFLIYSFIPNIIGILIAINLYLLIRFFTIYKCVY